MGRLSQKPEHEEHEGNEGHEERQLQLHLNHGSHGRPRKRQQQREESEEDIGKKNEKKNEKKNAKKNQETGITALLIWFSDVGLRSSFGTIRGIRGFRGSFAVAVAFRGLPWLNLQLLLLWPANPDPRYTATL